MQGNTNIKKVAIIGAGIAGLTFAASLKKFNSGIEEIIIYDSNEDILNYSKGGAVSLTSGTIILDQLDLSSNLLEYSNVVTKIKFFSQNNEEFYDIDLSTSYDQQNKNFNFPYPAIYFIRWSALRKILFDFAVDRKSTVESKEEILEQEEPERIHQTRVIYKNKKQVKFLQENFVDEKIGLHFVDESFEDNFDLVIGADGSKSLIKHYTKVNPVIQDEFSYMNSFLNYLAGFFPTLRMTECLTPPRESVIADSAGKITDETEEVIESIKIKCDQEVSHYIGNRCNVILTSMGNGPEAHYLLEVVYKELPASIYHGENPKWKPYLLTSRNVKQYLNGAGFNNFHEIHTLLEATGMTGGSLFDVSTKDRISPFDSWSSPNGRIILIGDSAHPLTPFYGLGANQAMQDAFYLSRLIYSYNTGHSIDILFQKSDYLPIFEFEFINFLLSIAYGPFKYIFDYFTIPRNIEITKMQQLALEFETKRKFPMFCSFIYTNIFGYLLTLENPSDLHLKDFLFYILSCFGLIQAFIRSNFKPVA